MVIILDFMEHVPLIDNSLVNGATVVSNYRFYQVGLIWNCQNLKVHSFFCLILEQKQNLFLKDYWENF